MGGAAQVVDVEIVHRTALLRVEEDDIKESNKRINFRVAIVRRGKRREKNLDKEGVHGNDSFDNLQRKIQVDFQNFIINFYNNALKAEYKRVRYSFKKINYKNKITVNFDYVSKLKSSSIKDLLNLEISDKYKAFNKNHNQIILSRIENEWLKKLFEMCLPIARPQNLLPARLPVRWRKLPERLLL